MAQVTLPPAFSSTRRSADYDAPTSIDFAADGRIFVAERAGRIFAFEDVNDTSPKLWASFTSRVFGASDRGLLAIELDPDFPFHRGVYVSYTQERADRRRAAGAR